MDGTIWKMTKFCTVIASLVPICFMILASAPLAHARNVNIFDRAYESLGVKISKGAIVHIADLRNGSAALMGRTHYLPAGTLLHLTGRSERRNGRDWNLAVTEHGLLVYVLQRLGSHFYNAQPLMVRGDGKIAIAHSKIAVPSEVYGEITIGPSEHYRFTFGDPGMIEVVIDKEKMGRDYKTDDFIEVPEENFSIVTTEKISRMISPRHFIEYDIGSEVGDILRGMADFELDSEDRQRIRTFLQKRFIAEKDCLEVAEFKHGFEGDAAVKLDSLLSPINASLGISGSITFASTLKEGTEFEIQRFALNSKVVEIKNETIRNACSDLQFSTRVSISDPTGRIAQIDSQMAADKLKLKVAENGMPIYRCRAEYLELLRVLIETFELTDNAAELAMVQGTRYGGDRKNASSCPARAAAGQVPGPTPRPSGQ